MIDTIKKTYFAMDEKHPKKVKLVRYLISGGTAAVVDLLLLYLLTDIFGIWYIISAIMAFLFAFLVSFTLQKYWTFKDHSSNHLQLQAGKYFLVTTTNLGLNTLGVFLFVHYGHFHYLASQFVVSAMIAIESYFVYHYIFKEDDGNQIY